MKLLYKVFMPVVLWATICFPALADSSGDDDTKVSKTISQGYLMGENSYLEITNKYGQILINNSANDSVNVKVEVIAYGKDGAAATKILERVDFDFVQTNQYLTLETVLDRKSGAFKELWNNIGDYSKTLLSKNKLEINYVVSVPVGTALTLNNKFGDVFIADRNQKVDIDMSHGDLRANDLNASSSITLSYGKAQIKEIKDGNLVLKSSQVTIKSIGAAGIESVSSEIMISKANEVTLNSRSDKLIEITKVERLEGKMALSNLKLGELLKSLDINLRYTDISIRQIPFNFSLIRIEGKYSDIDLDFDANTHMDVDIILDEDQTPLPFEGLTKEYVDDKKGVLRLRGIIGDKNNYKGNLNIDSEKGEINIRLQPQQSVKSN